jgi:malate dehydrogenase
LVLGEHGDHMVPIWSAVDVRGVDPDAVRGVVDGLRSGRTLADLPGEIVAARTTLLETIRSGDVEAAWVFVQSLPADLRVAIKPYFTNFTSGRTTEVVTAHAVADLVDAFVSGTWWAVPAQVWVRGVWHDLQAASAVPVVVAQNGWVPAADLPVAADELAALQEADRALAEAQSAALTNLQ